MASESLLNTLLDADGDLRIILAALIVLAVIFEFISFKFYNTALKWMRAAKLVEAISGSVFFVWDLIFIISVGITFKHFIRFAHVADILLTALFVTGSILTIVGLFSYIKQFLYGQLLICIYVFVEWICLFTHYTTDYTTPVERVSFLLLWVAQALNAIMGSFLIFDLHNRMKNEENMKPQEQLSSRNSSSSRKKRSRHRTAEEEQSQPSAPSETNSEQQSAPSSTKRVESSTLISKQPVTQYF